MIESTHIDVIGKTLYLLYIFYYVYWYIVSWSRDKLWNTCIDFEIAFWRALDMHAPEKIKPVRDISKQHIQKTTKRDIVMGGSDLATIFKKHPIEGNHIAFKNNG